MAHLDTSTRPSKEFAANAAASGVCVTWLDGGALQDAPWAPPQRPPVVPDA
jgi:hypothetical protein